MKKQSKVLALLLACVMVLGLTACAGDKKSTDADKNTSSAGTSTVESTPSTEDDNNEPATPGEIVNIKWAMVGNGMPDNYDAWKAKMDEYLGEKIGVHIDMEVVSWGDWDNRRNVIVKTGGDYDILFTNGGTYNTDVASNAFADLTELLETESPALYNMIPAEYWDAARVDGKIYAVPTYKDSSQSEFIVWDSELVKELDIDAASITTLEGLTEPLQKIKDHLNATALPMDKNGAEWVIYQYDQMSAGLPAIGVRFNDEKAKVVPVLEQEDVMKNLELLHDWYTKGIINSDAATLPEAPKYRPVQVAQGWAGAAKTTWGPNMGKEAEAYQWGPTVVSNDTVRGSLNAISAGSKNPAKALQFLEVVNTDTYVRDSFYYGLEGDDWVYAEDGRIHRNNENWTMAGYTQATFFNVTQTDKEEINQWDEVKALNENAEPSILLGFTFDTKKVADQLANCIQIYQRYKGEIFTGTIDPAEGVPSMMQEMRDAGFDDILAEAQTQVDAFMAKK